MKYQTAEDFFLDITPKHRETLKKSLEDKIAIILGTYIPGKDIYGKPKPYPTARFEWMLPHWQKALAELNRVMDILESCSSKKGGSHVS